MPSCNEESWRLFFPNSNNTYLVTSPMPSTRLGTRAAFHLMQVWWPGGHSSQHFQRGNLRVRDFSACQLILENWNGGNSNPWSIALGLPFHPYHALLLKYQLEVPAEEPG